MNESNEWFIARNNKKVGPFTWTQLLEQSGRGEIALADMLLQKGAAKWVQAESVSGLFAVQQPCEKLPLAAMVKGAEAQQETVALTQSEQVQDQTVSLVKPAPSQEETVSQGVRPPSTVSWDASQATAKATGPAGSLPGYEVLGVLGRGGMGVVYKARHLALQRIVALKMILAGDHADAADLERFRIEGQAVARLQHPNIVQIHEVGELDGRPFFSLEFADGGTLSARIKGEPTAPREAAVVVEQLARAMQHAHDHGIVHRDLKPGNVLFSADGTPKVTDFGLAKRLDADQNLSQTGAVLGTPSYMAPEQAEGKSEVGPAADVYALGVILYEMLTGRPPFKGATIMDTLDQVRAQEPVPPTRLARVPVDLETICLKCLHKSPKQRYGSAAELSDDLNRFLRGEPVKARPIGNIARAWRWCLRNKAVASLLAAVVVSLVGGIVVSVSYAIQAEINAADALAKKERADAKEKLATEETARANLETERATAQTKVAREQKEIADNKTAEAEQESKKAFAATEQFKKERDVARVNMDVARANMFGSQLLLVGRLWEREPGRARELLHDYNKCLLPQRDFTWHLMDRLSAREKWSAQAHGDSVEAICYSPDGKLLASAQGGFNPHDITIRLVDAATGKLKASLKEHSAAINALCFSRDGKTLVSAGKDSKIIVWDIATGKARATLLKHTGSVSCLALSPDDKLLASGGGDDGTILVWDLAAGSVRTTLTGHGKHRIPDFTRVVSVVFHPDGKQLFSAGRDELIKVWDLASGQPRTLKALQDLYGLALSPDGLTLAICGSHVQLWDLTSGAKKFLPEGASCRGVTFSKDGETLAATNIDNGAIRVWDAKTGQVRLTLFGQTAVPRGIALSPDGRTLANGDAKGMVRIWSLTDTDGLVHLSPPHSGDIACASFSGDGRTLVTVGNDRKIQFWDLATRTLKHSMLYPGLEAPRSVSLSHNGKILAGTGRMAGPAILDAESGNRLANIVGHKGNTEQIVHSPDGKKIVTIGSDDTARIWDAETRRELAVLPQRDNVHSVALSRNGAYLATGTFKGTALIWDAATGQELGTASAAGRALTGLALNPTGTLLAAGDGTGRLFVWEIMRPGNEVANGSGRAELRRLFATEGHKTNVVRLAFVGDGNTLASCSRDGELKLWDVRTRQERVALHVVGFFAVSPDGNNLVTAGPDGVVQIWVATPARGPLVAVWQGHPQDEPGGTRGLAFRGNSSAFVSCGGNNAVKLWDMDTAALQVDLSGHTGFVHRVLFTSDGQTLVSAGDDKTVRLWDPDTGKARHVLADHAGPVRALAVSPDGKLLASAGQDPVIRVWDIATGKMHTSLPTNHKFVSHLAFSKDGKTLVSTFEQYIHLWDLETGQLKNTFEEKQRIHALALSPDGTTLASAPQNLAINIRDFPTGAIKAAIQHRSGVVFDLQYSPDGRVLAGAENNGNLTLWNVATNNPLATLTGDNNPFQGVAFHSGGRFMVSGHNFGDIKLWDLTSILSAARF